MTILSNRFHLEEFDEGNFLKVTIVLHRLHVYGVIVPVLAAEFLSSLMLSPLRASLCGHQCLSPDNILLHDR